MTTHKGKIRFLQSNPNVHTNHTQGWAPGPAVEGPAQKSSVLILKVFFPLNAYLFLPYLSSASVLWFLILYFYGLSLCMCACVLLMDFYLFCSILVNFFHLTDCFLKVEKDSVVGWVGRIWVETGERKPCSEYSIWKKSFFKEKWIWSQQWPCRWGCRGGHYIAQVSVELGWITWALGIDLDWFKWTQSHDEVLTIFKR